MFPCWAKLTIPPAQAAGVGLFDWTTVPVAAVFPQNAQASQVYINLYGLNTNTLVFCVKGTPGNGVLKVGQGIVSIQDVCNNRTLIISPVPNPVSQSETLTVLLSGDAMDEIQQNNTPITLNFIRNSDGSLVRSLETTATENPVDVSGFQPGLHWITANYGGTQSASFIVGDQ